MKPQNQILQHLATVAHQVQRVQPIFGAYENGSACN
jgi:hypothetical protein